LTSFTSDKPLQSTEKTISTQLNQLNINQNDILTMGGRLKDETDKLMNSGCDTNTKEALIIYQNTVASYLLKSEDLFYEEDGKLLSKVYCNMALTYDRLNYHSQALEVSMKAINLDRTSPSGYLRLSKAYIKLNKLKNAW